MKFLFYFTGFIFHSSKGKHTPAGEKIIGKDRFKLVYMDADVEYCTKNDKYGLYKLSDKGKLSNLAGVDESYDTPKNPDVKYISHSCKLDEVLDIVS